MTLLFGGTLFLSAALVFAVQPMVARVVLPLLGGAPITWNVCVVFFQVALLGGYFYAHLHQRARSLWASWPVHLSLLALGATLLPFALPSTVTLEAAAQDSTGLPQVWWMIRYLALSVGLPFVLLSATAPLLQNWFARSSHADAGDPYFLYAASNAGSLLALLGYPLAIEPLLSLGAQRAAWAWGYGLLVALVGACGLAANRSARDRLQRAPEPLGPLSVELRSLDQERPGREAAVGDDPPTWRTRLWWIALAAVPSSLVLSVTTHVSTNLAAVPLLWVLPLSIYLLTFIAAFSKRPLMSTETAARYLPLAAIIPVIESISRALRMELVFMPFHFVFLALAGLVCHGVLAARRPAAAHLTEFYLWLSVGGALGGLLTTLVAPLVFVGITEYPLGIVAALLLRPGVRWATAESPRDALTTPTVVLVVMLVMAAVAHLLGAQVRSFLWLALIFAPALLISMLVWHRRVPFGLSVGAIVLVSTWFGSSGGEELYAERNFFGQIRVVLDDGGAYRVLVHGNTMHGMQPTDPTREFELVSYYHEKSGVAGVFSAVGPRLAASPVAVVGLGAGSLALYAQPNQHWTYYELNPSVIRVARDPHLFTMLSRAGGSVDVIPGDARLSLARAPDAHYGVIVLDAFSSDAIPVHLMTREAVELYFKKLAPGGVVVFHVSNRYLRLVPVLGSIAHDQGYHALSHSVSRMTESEMARGRTGGTWVAMARHAADLASLATDATWTPVSAGPDSTRWTDDYSNLVAVLALPWSQSN